MNKPLQRIDVSEVGDAIRRLDQTSSEVFGNQSYSVGYLTSLVMQMANPKDYDKIIYQLDTAAMKLKRDYTPKATAGLT